MNVASDGVYLQFTCGDPITGLNLALTSTLWLDAAGHFAAETTRLDIPRRNGGMATATLTREQTPVPPPYARLTGTTDGHTLTLNVELVFPEFPVTPGGPPLTSAYGPYTLIRGQADWAKLVRCTAHS
jgi:hypothetical protein